MSQKSLEDVIQAAGNPVTLLRNLQTGPNVYPGVPPEYTNWRDETQAWQKTCVLFNQSYHMADLAVEGPDAAEAAHAPRRQQLRRLRRRQGQAVRPLQLRRLRDRRRDPVLPRPRTSSTWWAASRCSTGSAFTRPPAATTSRSTLDERSAARPDPFNRKSYRFQLQGPNAMKVMEKVIGGKAPELKFFNMGHVTIAGKPVRALRHGMAGQPGLRAVRTVRRGDAVIRDAIVKAGEEFGLRLVGRPRLLGQHAGVGLDSVAAAGRLHRREDEVLSAVAPGRLLRGEGVDRRQLRLAEHRGLLPDAVGPRLRPARQVRSRLHRPRGARADAPRVRIARRSRSRSTPTT